MKLTIAGFAAKTTFEFRVEWPAVPRIGETIRFAHDGHDGEIIVDDVVWNLDANEDDLVWVSGSLRCSVSRPEGCGK